MKISQAIASILVAGAVVAGVLSTTQAAVADQIQLDGTITITPTSGNVNTDAVFLDSIAVSVGAPEGYRSLSGTFVFQDGVNMGAVSMARSSTMATSYGLSGLDGEPAFLDRSVSPTNNFVTNKLLNATSVALITGGFELRNYYFASSTAPDVTADPYVSLSMTYDTTSGAWSIAEMPGEAGSDADRDITAIETTTSLMAAATGGIVQLNATVKDDGDAATDATGSLIFKEGTTPIATIPLVEGVAVTTLSDIPAGTHVYVAEFQSADDVYAGSTSRTAIVQASATVATATVSAAAPSAESLILTGVSQTVELGRVALGDGTLNASGTFHAVVTDTRLVGDPSWSLTGQVSDFETTGGTTLSAEFLGWEPDITGDAAGSVAGADVRPAPTQRDGLKIIRTLAMGHPNPDGQTTDASALLQLKAPSNTPAGDYFATLTLTLI